VLYTPYRWKARWKFFGITLGNSSRSGCIISGISMGSFFSTTTRTYPFPHSVKVFSTPPTNSKLQPSPLDGLGIITIFNGAKTTLTPSFTKE